jgi:NAD(P)-dependent dehydrogenase (short-subunit alcohol dehydrogenase family)
LDISQKVVLVIGGSGSGCGRTITDTFARHGAAVAVSDISVIEQLQRELGLAEKTD